MTVGDVESETSPTVIDRRYRKLPRARGLDIDGIRPLVELDVGAPRIVNKREPAAGLRILRVWPIELDTGRFKLFAESFQVLNIKPNVIEDAAFRGHRRPVGFGKCQVDARDVGGLILAPRAGLRAERLRVPCLNL